jgi:hypothetical protein
MLVARLGHEMITTEIAALAVHAGSAFRVSIAQS